MSSIEKLIRKIRSKPNRTDIEFQEAVRVLKYFDYHLHRTRGSHNHFVNTNNKKSITIAVHGKRGVIPQYSVEDLQKIIDEGKRK